MDWKRRLTVLQVAEILTAIGLIFWRIWAVPLVDLWRDWVTLLALYWMFLVFVEEPRLRLRASIAVTTGLMLIYGWGHLPHVATLFGGLR